MVRHTLYVFFLQNACREYLRGFGGVARGTLIMYMSSPLRSSQIYDRPRGQLESRTIAIMLPRQVWHSFCSLGAVFWTLDVVATFAPAPNSFCAPWTGQHPHQLRHNQHMSSRRRWPTVSARLTTNAVTAAAAKRIDPPEDFIDISAVDEPGSESLAVDFERQELRVIFETMDRNNIFYKMLDVEQITEILLLTQSLLSVKKMPYDISKLCQGNMMKGKWKLDFSTEERYKFLPPTSDVFIYIFDGPGGGRLDNVIRFYKSWVVKSVRAVTEYKMDDRGKISFDFDRIEANLLGFKVPLPKLNSDKGFVEVQYFDGDLWIETFEEETTSTDSGTTTTVVNIYRRVGDATEEDKTIVQERTGEQRQPQR